MWFVILTCTCRNPKLWPDPERFDPDRFLGDRADNVDLYTYLPFLAGAHKCLGHQFAKAQMKIVIGGLLRQFRFTKPDGAEFKRRMRVTLKPDPVLTLNVAAI